MNTLRDNFPATAPGMVRTANYGTYDRALDADVVVLESAIGDLHAYPLVSLRFISRGFVPAGSCVRWDEACWSVQWTDHTNGTTHGRRFLPEHEAEARAYFGKLTDAQAVSARRQHDAMMEETVYAPARAKAAEERTARLAEEKARKAARRRYLRTRAA